MDWSFILEYGWVLFVLIGLEGILAADNAVVMAVMVQHLPEEKQKKALFYGLMGAFVFRFIALFLISILVNVWQIQALGAIYLLFMAVYHTIKSKRNKKNVVSITRNDHPPSFWMTVLKVELADIAFAIDSMLAAVALAITLKPTGWFQVGGIDGSQFIVMLLGGIIGLVMIRFAANWFVRLLKKYPQLETAAFLIVGWVGVKLSVFTLAHPKIHIINHQFPESLLWKLIFWSGLIGIALGGYYFSIKKKKNFNHNQGKSM